MEQKNNKPAEKATSTQKNAKAPSSAKSNKANTQKKPQKQPSKKQADTKKKNSDKFNFKYLTGILFAKMMRGGASELRANADEVNKLNVFPVPDGDTGDNMSMTIDSGIAALENSDSDDLAEVLQVLSRGMLLGARGNSGVILSQFFAGIAKGFAKSKKADAKALGEALKQGVEQAYTSVMSPTEGTILTVMREAVDYAVSRITPSSTIRTLFADLSGEMNASLARTPDILPQLKEAGVVDSGGAGLYYIIDGLNRVLGGEEVPDVQLTAEPPKHVSAVTEGSFGPDSEMTYGYCTEFLLQLQNAKTDIEAFSVEPLKAFLASIGDSVVAFKTESIVKVHVHTKKPDLVLGYCREFGEFLTVKIENMSVQHSESKSDKAPTPAPVQQPAAGKPVKRKTNGIVAVSTGKGIENLFREFGVDEVIVGGQTNNPSTNDFLEAFEKIAAEHIFVLPNNGNVIMAANQAAEIYDKAKVHVISTKSIGVGYVALSVFDPEEKDPEVILATANEAISRVTSSFVSPAVRNADMNGVHINEGDIIGIIGKEVAVSCPDVMSAAKALVDKLFDGTGAFMLTVFRGIEATDGQTEELKAYIAEKYPDVECYFIESQHEIYPFGFISE